CFVLQTDARDNVRGPRGRRQVSAGVSRRAGAFGCEFSANHEGLDGKRSRGGQPPRIGLTRRESGRAGTQTRRANASTGGGLRDPQAVSDGAARFGAHFIGTRLLAPRRCLKLRSSCQAGVLSAALNERAPSSN